MVCALMPVRHSMSLMENFFTFQNPNKSLFQQTYYTDVLPDVHFLSGVSAVLPPGATVVSNIHPVSNDCFNKFSSFCPTITLCSVLRTSLVKINENKNLPGNSPEEPKSKI